MVHVVTPEAGEDGVIVDGHGTCNERLLIYF